MTSCRPGDREFGSCAHGGDVFIGSFNINSGDLSVDAASAWLKGAERADIVALGLQVTTANVNTRVRQPVRVSRNTLMFYVS